MSGRPDIMSSGERAQTELLILHPWQEVVGTVEGIEIPEERGVLRLSLNNRIAVEILLNELMEDGANLVQLKGRKISILRTDRKYFLKRIMPDSKTGGKVP